MSAAGDARRPGADCPVCQGRDPRCLVRITAERRVHTSDERAS